MKKSKPIYIVMGATATGKSAYAIELAKKIDGEIVNADAMQIYRGLNIGTAKLSLSEQQGIPHHLFDLVDIHTPVDVNYYLQNAEKCVQGIWSRGKTPILCGGTGYYIKSFLYGLDTLPGDPSLRKELDALYDHTEGESALRARMQKEDPEDYQKYAYNRRKLIRALEVFIFTGRALASFHTENKTPRYLVEAFHILRDRDILRQRIFARVELMMQQGWIEEAQEAIREGLLQSPTARQAIGYLIINEHLTGKLSYAKMIDTIGTKTWQYARRQMTWFKNQHPEATPVIL